MSQKATTRAIAAYLLVVWTAALVQIDEFPLTWAPMYSRYEPSDALRPRVVDPVDVDRGLLATHGDGSLSRVTRQDLNVSKRHFRRLYRQRLTHTRDGDLWHYRVLRSINRTLGHEPDDASFIVKLEPQVERWTIDRTDLEIAERMPLHAAAEWNDRYRGWWNDEAR